MLSDGHLPAGGGASVARPCLQQQLGRASSSSLAWLVHCDGAPRERDSPQERPFRRADRAQPQEATPLAEPRASGRGGAAACPGGFPAGQVAVRGPLRGVPVQGWAPCMRKDGGTQSQVQIQEAQEPRVRARCTFGHLSATRLFPLLPRNIRERAMTCPGAQTLSGDTVRPPGGCSEGTPEA